MLRDFHDCTRNYVSQVFDGVRRQLRIQDVEPSNIGVHSRERYESLCNGQRNRVLVPASQNKLQNYPFSPRYSAKFLMKRLYRPEKYINYRFYSTKQVALRSIDPFGFELITKSGQMFYNFGYRHSFIIACLFKNSA